MVALRDGTGAEGTLARGKGVWQGVWLFVAASPRRWLALIAIAAAAGLAGAFILQWGFGVRPCILCLYQRIPYAALAAIAGAGALFAAAPTLQRRLLRLCAVVSAAGVVLAFYHVGVENHWWASAVGCEVDALPTFNVNDLTAAPLAPLKPCDEVDFRVFGLSLAGWNVAAMAAFALACLTGAARRRIPSGEHA